MANEKFKINGVVSEVVPTIGTTGDILKKTVSGVEWGALAKATQAEAEAGTDDTKIMTPLRVKQAVVKLAPVPNYPVTSVNSKTGAVTISKSDVGLSNVDNVKQMPISGGVLENYREKLTTVTVSGGSINLSLGNVFQHTPSGNITYSITNAVSGQAHSFTLIINIGSTVRTLTFPSSVKWQGGEIPDMSTANKSYVLTFMSVNGGTTWLGMFGGEF